jgi:hypothetical protein
MHNENGIYVVCFQTKHVPYLAHPLTISGSICKDGIKYYSIYINPDGVVTISPTPVPVPVGIPAVLLANYSTEKGILSTTWNGPPAGVAVYLSYHYFGKQEPIKAAPHPVVKQDLYDQEQAPKKVDEIDVWRYGNTLFAVESDQMQRVLAYVLNKYGPDVDMGKVTFVKKLLRTEWLHKVY